MKHSLQAIAELIGARIVGDSKYELSAIGTAAGATAEELVFVEDVRHLPAALDSGAGAIITGEFAAAANTRKPLLIVRYPKLAFARAAAMIYPPRHYEPGVHSTAALHHSVKLGQGVTVQPNAVLSEGVIVGDCTRIGPGAVLGPGVRIGCNCDIAASVTLYPGTTIGDRVTVHAGAVLGGDGFGFVRDPESGRYEKFPQIGSLEIQDDVEIGCNTTIDRGALGATIVGRGTKIDNLVQIAHNCRIGENVVIAAQTGISGSCVVEDGVIIGGQVGIGDHCHLEKGVILGGRCGVTSNKVLRGTGVVYWGTPARPLKGYLKELAVLSRMAKKD